MAQAYNPSYSGGRDREEHSQGQPGQIKVHEIPILTNCCMQRVHLVILNI
jgi:hypothetical protein